MLDNLARNWPTFLSNIVYESSCLVQDSCKSYARILLVWYKIHANLLQESCTSYTRFCTRILHFLYKILCKNLAGLVQGSCNSCTRSLQLLYKILATHVQDSCNSYKILETLVQDCCRSNARFLQILCKNLAVLVQDSCKSYTNLASLAGKSCMTCKRILHDLWKNLVRLIIEARHILYRSIGYVVWTVIIFFILSKNLVHLEQESCIFLSDRIQLAQYSLPIWYCNQAQFQGQCWHSRTRINKYVASTKAWHIRHIGTITLVLWAFSCTRNTINAERIQFSCHNSHKIIFLSISYTLRGSSWLTKASRLIENM